MSLTLKKITYFKMEPTVFYKSSVVIDSFSQMKSKCLFCPLTDNIWSDL